jgi:uncharacterized protein YndB with AHSA1/START domain
VSATGTITADGVRFERLYDATTEELWAALTDPEQLRGWLAHASRWTLQPGEEWEIRFENGTVDGRVVSVEHGRLLELTWMEERGESLLRFEIVPQEQGCLLVLDHSRLGAEVRPGYGAGWQAHLETLAVLLEGGDEFDWWARYDELRPAYEEQTAPLP